MKSESSNDDVEVVSLLGDNNNKLLVMKNGTNNVSPSSILLQRSQSYKFNNDRDDDDLPTQVCETSQLYLLPKECLSHNETRPLRHVDDLGNEYTYALKPMRYSVWLILLVELMERFSFFGMYFTQTLYLTGAYNEEWNAGYSAVGASSLVSVSTAVAYTTPFLGAILADHLLGDFHAILYGLLFFYLPGIILIALSTVPHLLGEEFNQTALTFGLTVLWPLGTGIIKSVVNVFGAKQHHPILQSALIERYYVSFYITINFGALVGITLIPILAQQNVTVAYMIPVTVLSAGFFLFVLGTPRYVIGIPRRRSTTASNNADTSADGPCGKCCFSSTVKSLSPFAARQGDSTASISLFSNFRISALIIPFCIVYSQMPTTFIVQGSVMKKAFGVVDAATMNSADAAAVLLFGYLTGHYIYPALSARKIKIPTTYKFAIGSVLAALALLWALFVEHKIHAAYANDQSQISIMWQSVSYILIGWGEVFAVSSAYEAAFSSSSPDKKALASAINIFCIGGIPNIICIFLFHACKQWFLNRRGDANISRIQDYTTAHVANYFWVLLAILFFGIFVNLHPRVRRFVESIEDRAVEITKTPILKKPRRLGSDEESPLLGGLRQEQFLKYAPGPVLNRMGSMRAGPSILMSRKDLKGSRKQIKYKYIPRLYKTAGGDQNDNASPSNRNAAMAAAGADGFSSRQPNLKPAKVTSAANSDTRRLHHYESA